MSSTKVSDASRGSGRYGDAEVIRALARSLRHQGHEVEAEAERLQWRTASTLWTGAAADAMRATAGAGVRALRRTAELHAVAAESLVRHADEVDRRTHLIAVVERAALAAPASLLGHLDLPPSGHRDWLTVHLPFAVPGLASLTTAATAGAGR